MRACWKTNALCDEPPAKLCVRVSWGPRLSSFHLGLCRSSSKSCAPSYSTHYLEPSSDLAISAMLRSQTGRRVDRLAYAKYPLLSTASLDQPLKPDPAIHGPGSTRQKLVPSTSVRQPLQAQSMFALFLDMGRYSMRNCSVQYLWIYPCLVGV